MNDKIALQIPYYDYRQNNQFDNNFGYTKTEFNQPNKELKVFEKWHCNKGNFNADVNNKGLYLKFNPNKLHGFKYSTEPLPFAKIVNSFDVIEEELHSVGIDTNLKQAKFSRIDNSFDVITNSQYESYEPLIKTISKTTKPFRRGRKRIEENTLYIGNKSNEFSIYDKTKEIEFNYGIILTENITRFEFRHLKAKTMKLCLNQVNEEFYHKLRLKDKTVIQNYIFNKNPMVLQNELYELFATLYNSGYTKPQINNIIVQKQLQIWNNEGFCIEELLTTTTKNQPLYKRGLQYKQMLNENITVAMELKQRYEELKQLFERVA
jgi:hypothetical protein